MAKKQTIDAFEKLNEKEKAVVFLAWALWSFMDTMCKEIAKVLPTQQELK